MSIGKKRGNEQVAEIMYAKSEDHFIYIEPIPLVGKLYSTWSS